MGVWRVRSHGGVESEITHAHKHSTHACTQITDNETHTQFLILSRGVSLA